MKLATTLLLLVVGSCCLFQGCAAGVLAHSQQVLDDELLQASVPLEVENKQEDIAPIFERNLFVKPIERVEREEDYVEPAPEDELVQAEPAADLKPQGRASGCQITMRGGLPTPQPVYLQEGSNDFYPYDNTGVMHIDSDGALEMWCSDTFSSIAKSLITAKCVSGSNFKVDGTTYSIKELTCKSWPSFTAEKTGVSCNGGTIVRAGFKISSSRFAKQYEVCFNEAEEVTRYVHHELNPGSNYYQSGVDRLTFQTAGMFTSKSVDNLYKQASHQAVISAQLGTEVDKYFNSNKNVYLARGHMAAKADFAYGTEQRATFLFVNVAPQWQVFNAGNWERVEDGVRTKVSKSNWYVDCYTGVYDVATLPNKNGVQTPLYLTYDSNNNGLIPVPKFYFRVVIERSSQKGIVFIGINNPHLTLAEIEKDYILCNDISDKVDYVNWKRTDITAGYSYACEVDDFKKTVKNLPALSAPGGLLL